MGYPYNTHPTPMWGSSQVVTFGSTASATQFASQIPSSAVLIRVVANTAVFINVQGSASAAAGAYCPANTVCYFPVGGTPLAASGSSGPAISIKSDTTSGTAWLVPCAT